MNWSAWRHLFSARDIRRKLLITLLILLIYRLAAHIVVPGADREAIAQAISRGGTFTEVLNMLSGGTVSKFSLLAMGVYPYITAQIILQLLVPIIPAWKKRMEEDPREGQKWMEKWTYYLAVPMAALNAIGQINIFSNLAGRDVIPNFNLVGPHALASWMVITSMMAGTMFAIWLGELISEYGMRNQGLSLVIFAGIVAQIPNNLAMLVADKQSWWIMLILMSFVMVGSIFAIVYVQQGRRNIPVMYPGRRMGRGMSMPVKGTLPLMVNMAGMIPLIFAQSILTFPSVLANMFIPGDATGFAASLRLFLENWFGGRGDGYWLLYFLMVVGFTFFYSTVLFDQQNYGENLKKVGAQIPGVSRGAPTQRYLQKVLSRITLPGAVFLGVIATLPFVLNLVLQVLKIGATSRSAGLLLVSASGLLIIVGVVRDLFFNIDAELKLHGYDDTLLVR